MAEYSEPRTIYLHVGTHKTGTTSFQISARQTADDFARAGIAVHTESIIKPNGRPVTRVNAVKLANLIIRRRVMTGARLRGTVSTPDSQVLPAMIKACRRSLNRRKQRDILVSAEGLCFARTGAEARRLCRLFAPSVFRLVPILVLRNRADWQASWQDQLGKDARMAEGMRKLSTAARIDAPWYYDCDRIVDFWRAVGELRIIDHDDAVARYGWIIPAIPREIGVVGRVAPIDIRANTRQTGQTATPPGVERRCAG